MAVEQIGAGQADASQFPAEQAEGQVRMTRHWSQQGGGVELDIADPEHLPSLASPGLSPPNWQRERFQRTLQAGCFQRNAV